MPLLSYLANADLSNGLQSRTRNGWHLFQCHCWEWLTIHFPGCRFDYPKWDLILAHYLWYQYRVSIGQLFVGFCAPLLVVIGIFWFLIATWKALQTTDFLYRAICRFSGYWIFMGCGAPPFFFRIDFLSLPSIFQKEQWQRSARS
jgi:hypothetical protein